MILPMKRITVYAYGDKRKKVLETLQRRQAVEITDASFEGIQLDKLDKSAETAIFERNITEAKNALTLLDEYAPVKKPMFSLRREEKLDSFEEKVSGTEKAVKKCSLINGAAKRISDLTSNITRIRGNIISLTPWTRLDIPMSYSGTACVASFIGTIPEDITQAIILESLPDFPQEAEISVISSSKEQTCLHVFASRAKAEQAETMLRSIGFSRPGWSLSHKTCAEKISLLEKEISGNEADITKAKDYIKDSADSRGDIEFLIDYLTMRKEKYEVLGKLSLTKHVFILTGWIPEKWAGGIIDELDRKCDAYVELFDPDPEEEDLPTVFQNGPFVNPVENITESYAMPGKGDIDPNPFMAFFYYLLFGLMLSDAGYGLLMGIATGYLAFFAKVEERTKKNMRMFFFCSVSTVFWGAIFGSWFGDLFTRISYGFMDPPIGTTVAAWFDPMTDPMMLMFFSIGVGIVHILLGQIASFYKSARQKDYFSALTGPLMTILMLLGISAFAVSMMLGEGFAIMGTIGMYTAMAALVIFLLVAGWRGGKGLLKFAAGLMALYDVLTGFMSDILSYSRLMALGLTTGAIGMVVNNLGVMFGSGAMLYIVFPLIFLFGHSINFGINLLGAYVHCNRLQYVEFYKQFYDGGGRKFKPFAANTNYIKFEEEKTI